LIDSTDQVVQYLRSFQNKLEVLTLKGNPCEKENTAEYKNYIVAYLSDLKYLDYETINNEDKEKANAAYQEEIADRENQRANDKNETQTPSDQKG